MSDYSVIVLDHDGNVFNAHVATHSGPDGAVRKLARAIKRGDATMLTDDERALSDAVNACDDSAACNRAGDSYSPWLVPAAVMDAARDRMWRHSSLSSRVPADSETWRDAHVGYFNHP